MAVAALAVRSNYPLSIIHCKAQPQLSLEQAIRQAQDSTIIAFQSQHEYDLPKR
jgi:hypothetical protein